MENKCEHGIPLLSLSLGDKISVDKTVNSSLSHREDEKEELLHMDQRVHPPRHQRAPSRRAGIPRRGRYSRLQELLSTC